MSDEHIPIPEPSGALVPPPTRPPTALATAAPEPPWLFESVRRAVNAALDVADDLARAFTETFGAARDRRP